MNDSSEKDPMDDPVGQEKKGSSLSGLAILGMILVVCVIIAYFLTMLVNPGPQREVVKPPPLPDVSHPSSQMPDGTVDDVNGDADDSVPEWVGQTNRPPRMGIEASIFQLRGLATISQVISQFRLETGEYPDDFSKVLERIDFHLPENPFEPGTPVEYLQAGEYKPGGFSYHPFINFPGGLLDGFVLFGYAETEEAGITVDDPDWLIGTSEFDPPLEVPITGIAVAVDEAGEPVDLSHFQ